MVRSGFPDPDELLLGGRLRPLTDGLMFVVGGVDAVCEAFGGRQWVPTWSASSGARLEEVLLRLEPLSIPHHRKLLIMPTEAEGVTAVFEDSLDGSSLALLGQVGNLGFDGVGVVSTPNDLHQIAPSWWTGSYGYRKFSEVRVDPGSERGFEARGIRLITENGRRWELGTAAVPWSATWDPTARRVVDRFTHDHLVASAAARELRPFDEDFYVPSGSVLLEHHRETYEGEKWGTLATAQGREPRALRSYLKEPPPSPWPSRPSS